MALVNITASIGHEPDGHSVQRPLDDVESGRFWALVDRGAPDACWFWRGALAGKHGYRYGRFGVLRGGRIEHLYAHRLAYELTHGPLAPGLVACHRCDHSRCCNPSHLFPGTQGDNLRDASRKGRFHVPRPTAHKVTAEQLADIDRMLANGVTRQAIARHFGVSKTWVSLYAKGQRRQYDRPQSKQGAA